MTCNQEILVEPQILTQKYDFYQMLQKPTCGKRESINEHLILVRSCHLCLISDMKLNFYHLLSLIVFDEDFVFEVRPATIGRRTLEILLYDFDAYSRHVCIGGLKIALAHVDLSDKVELWKSLGPCSEQDAKIELGDIMVSLSYLPSAERLTCVVIKARNLRVFDDTRNSSGN